MNIVEIEHQLKIVKKTIKDAFKEFEVLQDEINLLIKEQERANAKPI